MRQILDFLIYFHEKEEMMKLKNHKTITLFLFAFVLFPFLITPTSCTSPNSEAPPDTEETAPKPADVVPKVTWGKNGKIGLSFVRTIGDAESNDPNSAFFYPFDMAVDDKGNIYVLDSGNHRIQIFSPEGEYLATIGREGEGPVEFMYPGFLDIDNQGNLVVLDPGRRRLHIISPDGTEDKFMDNPFNYVFFDMECLPKGGFIASANINRPFREGVPMQDIKRLKIHSRDGTLIKEFVDCIPFEKDFFANNAVFYDASQDGSVYVSFKYQNRIEKYSDQGELVWRVSRPLNYNPGFQAGKSTTTGRATQNTVARNSPCSEDIAADSEGRAWVLTFDRQMNRSEAILAATWMTGKREVTRGDTSLRFTDAYKIEVFDSDKELIDTIPITHFTDSIDVYGDNLFLIDKYRGMQVYQYQILMNQ